MKKIIKYLLNLTFFGVVIIAAVAIASFSVAKKVNDATLAYKNGIVGTVVKQVVPVLSFEAGVVNKINVAEGDEVKKGQVLMELDNPVLKNTIDVLRQYADNVSAQTQARVGEAQLKGLEIIAPVDGVVGTIPVVEGSSVDNLATLLTIYSFQNERLLVNFSLEQYSEASQITTITAYSQRLNQTFVVTPDKLKPQEEKPTDPNAGKQIGMYFLFKNQTDAKDLLDNEDLSISFDKNKSAKVQPTDMFVKFWNGLYLDPL